MEGSETDRLSADIAFIKKVAAIGEHDRASKMARHLLARMSPLKFQDRKVIEFLIDVRRVLIGELQELRRIDDSNYGLINEIYNQSEILVDDLMLVRDIRGAVGLLAHMAEHGEHDRCWESLIRITNEFSRERDLSIIDAVCEAFDWIIDICRHRGNEVEFSTQCHRFAEYLSSNFVRVDLVCKYMRDYNDWFSDRGRAELLLEMVVVIKRRRNEEIGLSLNRVEGDNFFFLGDYKKAITSYMDLVLYENWHDEHNDYLLWIAGALTALGQYNKADMFAHVVLRNLGEDSVDERVLRAKKLLGQSSS